MEILVARNAGQTLRDARLAAGLSQTDLAERIDVSRRWVIDVESGANTSFHFDLYLRALEILGLRMRIERAHESDRAATNGEDRRTADTTSTAAQQEQNQLIDSYFDDLRRSRSASARPIHPRGKSS